MVSIRYGVAIVPGCLQAQPCFSWFNWRCAVDRATYIQTTCSMPRNRCPATGVARAPIAYPERFCQAISTRTNTTARCRPTQEIHVCYRYHCTPRSQHERETQILFRDCTSQLIACRIGCKLNRYANNQTA